MLTKQQQAELAEVQTESFSTFRPTVRAVEEILSRPFPVLDQGFVRVVDYMGADASIVQAARVSYGHGTKHIHEDRGLIRYLMRHRHTTPFEMCEIKFHLRVPMDCWRQWIRHRTANVNEYSTRYSIAIDAAQETPPSAWRLQSEVNKQGSGEFLDTDLGEELSREEKKLLLAARKIYERRLERGVAREQARKDLPLSTYTEAYWKIDLHNLLHFLGLRAETHAQWEIRQYAEVMLHEVVQRWVPITYGAFLDYTLNATRFSAKEMQALQVLLGQGQILREVATPVGASAFGVTPGTEKKNRELGEFLRKLEKLGFLSE